VPYDGAVDPTLVISGTQPGGSVAQQAAAPQQQQQQQQQQRSGWGQQQQQQGQQGQQQQSGWGQKQQSGAWGQKSDDKSSWSNNNSLNQGGGGGGNKWDNNKSGSWNQQSGGGGGSWGGNNKGGGGSWGQGGNQWGGGKGGAGGEQMQEARKKMEEQNKVRMEEMKKQQEELMKKQAEEKKKREEELAKKRQEQMSIQMVKQTLNKFRFVQEAQMAELQEELVKVLQEHLDKCGEMKDKIKEEAEAAVTQAKERLVKLAEQKKKEEELKAEMERKRKESVEKAKELLVELAELVDAADGASTELAKEAEDLSLDKEMKIDDINATGKGLNSAGEDAKEKVKACTDFIKAKGADIRALDRAKPEEKPDAESHTMPKLMQKINDATKRNEMTLFKVSNYSVKATKKHAAKKALDAQNKLFDKYDKDKDGMLSQAELKKYAKGEYDFDVPAAALDAMWKFLVIGSAKGVKKVDFHRLQVSVGCAREKAKDLKRREARIEHENKIAAMKEKLQETLKSAAVEVEVADNKIKEVEKAAEPMPKSKTMHSTQMVKLSEEVDEAVKGARDATAEAKKTVDGISEGVHQELKLWLLGEVKKLEFAMARFEPRLTKVAETSTKFRDGAKKRDAEELKIFEKRAIAMLKYHQEKKGLSSADLFTSIDTKKDDKIDQAEFLAFFKTCEKKPKEAPKEEAKEEGKEEAKKEEAPEEAFTEDDLKRTFKYLDDDEEGGLTKEKFTSLIRVFLKVAKDTVVTADVSIKDSKTLRRLDVGEVLEVLSGEVEEEAVKVMRLKVRVMKDDIQGYVTKSGNQGTLFLEEGGNLFKCVAETILTEAFSLDGTGAKPSTLKIKDMTRKLKVGEIVEVREWPKKEEKSGLMRMKCRTMDGLQGYATTVGNTGNVFLEVK